MSSENVLKILPFVGSALLFVGVFCPAFTIAFGGSVSVFTLSKLAGILLILVAVANVAATVARRYAYLWATGGVTFALGAFEVIKLLQAKSQATGKLNGLGDNPLAASIGKSLVNSIHVSWGIAVIFLGSILILSSAFIYTKGVPSGKRT